MGNYSSLHECPEKYSALPQRPLVINLGLAKSGTTSLHEFFRCSGWCSRHDWGTLTHAMLATLAFAQSRSTVNADAILRARLGTPADVLAEVDEMNSLDNELHEWAVTRFCDAEAGERVRARRWHRSQRLQRSAKKAADRMTVIVGQGHTMYFKVPNHERAWFEEDV